MEIKRIRKENAKEFYDFLKKLDQETKFMMYEPDERQWNQNKIMEELEKENNLYLGIFHDTDIVGFLSAEAGKFKRNRHSAYIVIGIRKDFQNQGLGGKLFEKLDDWAKENQLVRLELTVEVSNIGAIKLYEKHGFFIEATKNKTMLVDNELVDEYMMAKLY